MSRTTFHLLRNEPRSWLALLVDFIIDQLRDELARGSISAEGAGALEGTPALEAVSALGSDNTVVFESSDSAAMVAFRAAVLESKRARLSSVDGTEVFDAKNGCFSVTVRLTSTQQASLQRWVEAHGCSWETTFRHERKMAPKVQPVGVQLKAGERGQLGAEAVAEELRNGLLDVRDARVTKGRLELRGRGPRLVPKSGLFGKMGRFDFTITIDPATSFVIDDLQGLGSFPVTIGHYDPAEKRLHLGSPGHGFIEVRTATDSYVVEVEGAPAQVRRWMRWGTSESAD